MKTTVRRAVSERQVKDEADAVPVLNKEVIPVIKEMREALNQKSSVLALLGTAATGMMTTLWQSDPMPTDSTWHIRARVIGRSTAGPAETAAYVREALFANVAGVVSQVGATASVSTFETSAGSDVQFVVAGQTIALQVQDDGVSSYAWKALVDILPSDEAA